MVCQRGDESTTIFLQIWFGMKKCHIGDGEKKKIDESRKLCVDFIVVKTF